MKNLLKSSVSVAVLLGQFATFGPVYAGAGVSRAKSNPNEEKSVSSLPKKTKSSRRKSSNAQEVPSYSIVTSQSSAVWKAIEDSNDILKLIFLYNGFDAETTQNSALVSKKWHEAIRKAKAEFRDLVMASNMDLRVLKQFLVHPSLCTLGQDLLISKFAYKEIYNISTNRQKETLSPKDIDLRNAVITNCAALTEIQLGIPENSILSNDLTYHPAICEYFAQLNPLDYKATALAAYTIQQNPSLPLILEGFLAWDPIQADQVPALIADVKNHDRLKKHLMTLKLLTLSGHEDAKRGLASIEKAIVEQNNPQAVELSLWSPYMVNMGHNSLFAKEFGVLEDLLRSNNNPALNNLVPFEAFGNYIGALAPSSNSDSLENFYRRLEGLKYFRGHQNVVQGHLDFLEYQLQVTTPENVDTRMSLAFQYAGLNHNKKAKEVSEGTKTCHESAWNKAEFILAQNDVNNFDVAKDCLERIQYSTRFHASRNDAFDYNRSEFSKAAINIYKGEFDEALRVLETPCSWGEKPKLLDVRSLLNALKTQHSKMPEELKEFFIDRLQDQYKKTSLNESSASDVIESNERFLCEYEEVFQSLLKDKPEDLCMYNQKVKAIKQKYQPVVVDNKGKKRRSSGRKK